MGGVRAETGVTRMPVTTREEAAAAEAELSAPLRVNADSMSSSVGGHGTVEEIDLHVIIGLNQCWRR